MGGWVGGWVSLYLLYMKRSRIVTAKREVAFFRRWASSTTSTDQSNLARWVKSY